MPGLYLADRSQLPGRAGLMLPYTPTFGPLEIGVDVSTFLDKPMGRTWEGDFDAIDGLRTTGMADCIVVCVAEWGAGRWGRGYFHHIPGGSWFINTDDDFRRFRAGVDPNRCFSVAMAHVYTGATVVTDQLAQYFPRQFISLYINQVGTSHVAVARFGGLFGEYFSDGTDKGVSYMGRGYQGAVP